MEEITIPVPADRFADFYALYATWLAAPAGAMWTHSVPSTPAVQAWDPARAGETGKASQLWQSLDESQRTIIDAVAVAGKVEMAQLAIVLSLKGPIAVAQQIVAVNAAAHKLARAAVLTVSVQVDQPVVEIDSNARKALLLEA
jgi:hypothetical protein